MTTLIIIFRVIISVIGILIVNKIQSMNMWCDDTDKEKKEYNNSNSIGIDELINDQLDNDVYSNHYFPNFTSGKFKQDDINKYMSIPLITSIKLGSYDMTFEYKKFPKYWNCTYMDLNENGKSFYKTIKDIYPDKEIRILTFVNNIF